MCMPGRHVSLPPFVTLQAREAAYVDQADPEWGASSKGFAGARVAPARAAAAFASA